MQLLPADKCCVCENAADTFYGARIIARGDLWLIPTAGVFQPRGSRLIGEATARAMSAFGAGLQPWVCQRCAGGPFCAVCGHCQVLASGAEVVYEDGEIRHHPILPGVVCLNPTCSSRRSPE
jgi:hypothetical protein